MIGAGIPKAQLMDSDTMSRVLTRMAHEIMERADDLQDLILVGIRRRGVPLAQRLADVIEKVEGVRVPVGELDITLYRDDLSRLYDQPQVDFTKSRNVIISALIMSLALGINFSTAGAIAFQVGGIDISLSGLAIASLVGVILNAILPGNDYVFGQNSQGDTSVNFKV